MGNKAEKLSEVQKIELEIFRTIQNFCDENNINYFICGGTLLGAVRHKGFIPWDDDIDIALLRAEYNKLCNKLKNNRYLDKKHRYKALLPLDENYIYPYIKVIDTYTIAEEKSIAKKYTTGLWVDIFPYDYGINTKEEIHKICKKHSIYKKFFQVGISGELTFKQKVLKGIAYIPYKIMTRGDYTYWIKKMLSLPKVTPTNYVGCFVWKRDEKDFYPVEWFDKFTDLQFEDMTVRAPANYDEFLTHFYGDYMTLPPVEKRQIHKFEWKYIKKDKKK